MKKIIIIISLVLLALLVLTSCYKALESNTVDTFLEEENYTKHIKTMDEDTLVIYNDVAKITIEQKDVREITMKIREKIGGNDEKKVKDSINILDYILSREDGKIIVNSTRDEIADGYFNSITVDCLIEIPKTIENIEVSSEVGNLKIIGSYKDVDASLDVGNVEIIGNVDYHNLNTNVGNLMVNGKKLIREEK